jgi:hypothetical protein
MEGMGKRDEGLDRQPCVVKDGPDGRAWEACCRTIGFGLRGNGAEIIFLEIAGAEPHIGLVGCDQEVSGRQRFY